jgi:hypothetical protein
VDADGFWALVARTREEATAAASDSVVGRHVATLTAALQELPDDQLRDFAREFRTARARANRWDLWAAASLALGGAGEDTFLDFRNWLVSHGRETFERVLADPDAVADLEWDDDENDFGAAEHWAYVVTEVLEKRGLDLEDDDEEWGEPAGQPFPEDDDEWFAARFPRLWAEHGAPAKR